MRDLANAIKVSAAVVVTDTFKNFVGGRWKSSRTGQTFENENPAVKGSNLGFFQSSSPEDIDEAIGAADARVSHMAPHDGGGAPAVRRRSFCRLLKTSRDELARIVTLENGKTLRESRAEVDSALVEGNYHLTQVSAFYGHTGPGAFRDITTWVQYQPLGVVGVISPWNFPMNVMCRKTLPALLTGNTVVFKPASFTPWSGVFMAESVRARGSAGRRVQLRHGLSGRRSATVSSRTRACAQFRSRDRPRSERRSRRRPPRI